MKLLNAMRNSQRSHFKKFTLGLAFDFCRTAGSPVKQLLQAYFFLQKIAEMEREREEREKGVIKIPRELIGNIQLGKMNLVEGTSMTTTSNFIS